MKKIGLAERLKICYNGDGQCHMWRFSFRGGLVRISCQASYFFAFMASPY